MKKILAILTVLIFLMGCRAPVQEAVNEIAVSPYADILIEHNIGNPGNFYNVYKKSEYSNETHGSINFDKYDAFYNITDAEEYNGYVQATVMKGFQNFSELQEIFEEYFQIEDFNMGLSGFNMAPKPMWVYRGKNSLYWHTSKNEIILIKGKGGFDPLGMTYLGKYPSVLEYK